MGLCPKGKDVQNQSGPVYDTATGDFFQIAFLNGRDGLIDNDQICTTRGDSVCDLLRLSAANKSTRLRSPPGRSNTGYDTTACRFRQPTQFLKV